MPLRDHFRPPTTKFASWEELHGGWPMVIVQQLRKQLPLGFVAAPRVHAGASRDRHRRFRERPCPREFTKPDRNGGVATAVWAPGAPTFTVETAPPDDDEYEVRIYDTERGRALVAAIELVSPPNKDRREKRNAFVGKCAALLRHGVAVSMVDLVTIRQFNLYAELMTFLGHPDPTLGPEPPAVYAASCRWLRQEVRGVLETWSHALTVGQPLPTLPLWLTADL